MRVVAPAWRPLTGGVWAAKLDEPESFVLVRYPDGALRAHPGDAIVTWRAVPEDPVAFYRGAVLGVALTALTALVWWLL